MPDLTRLTRRHLLIVAAVALVLRLAAFFIIYIIQQNGPTVLGGGDAAGYASMAHYVFIQGVISNELFLPRPPLFPALAGVLYHVVGENAWPIIGLNVLLNVITCVLVYQLARAINQTPRRALIAGLLAAVYPAMIWSSISYMTEALFLFFCALALLLLARFVSAPNWRDLTLSAATLACATLARVITLTLPLVLLVLLVRRGSKWKQYTAIFLLISALPWAVLTFRNWYYAGIFAPSTNSQWILLFMRATSSERRATGEDAAKIYARYVQEIERRLGNPVPPLDSIRPEAIWGYFQPTAAMHAVISQMAIEKNLAYPQWYIINSFYGLHRILSTSDEGFIPPVIHIPLHYAFVLLACVGLWRYWRQDRRWAWLLGLTALFAIGTTVALETAVLSTRHGLPAALPMFVLASEGLAVVWLRVRRSLARSAAIPHLQSGKGAGLQG